MEARLKDKTAIVTGGATGIGRATSELFAAHGAKVLINALPDDPVEEAVEAIRRAGGAAEGFGADVSDAETADRCVQAAIDAWGRLDILVNNAGTLPPAAPFHEAPIDSYAKTMKANVQTSLAMTRAALPHLRKVAGAILFTGSEAGVNGKPRNVLYGAAKGWMHAFAKGLAVEQADAGVRVNCVCPGPVDTRMLAGEEQRRQARGRIPLGRLGRPEDVAHAMLYLAADEASFVTGELLMIDGGEYLGKLGGG